MVFRHPHVFRADGSLLPEGEAPSAKEIADTWEIVKAKEKDGNKTVMSGIPDTMPALLRALSMQEKARGCGFDWKDREGIWDKVKEECREITEAGTAEDLELEFGDLMFTVINAARLYGVDPEAALSRTCGKFRRRFDYLERKVREDGRGFDGMTMEEMDAFWDEAKSKGL
jgi:XTP/dITP diphosphohydrolase